ncbi:MAG: glutaredoxin family protein [Candidatus Saccharibacteria bacterium]|jgi:glutaredoxin-like YruB-family protein|nr:glutaredoxin family protein [Patescibacteria group bacterium]
MSEEKTVQDKAIIYSTPTCQFCKNVEAYLDEKGYKFEKIDVSADPAKAQEMIDKSGQMGVPVTEIKGAVIVGWDKPKFEALFA